MTSRALACILAMASVLGCAQQEVLHQADTASDSTRPIVALGEEPGGEVVSLSGSAMLSDTAEELRAFPYTIGNTTQTYNYIDPSTKRWASEDVKVHYATFNTTAFNGATTTVPVIAVLRNKQWPDSRASLVFPLEWDRATDKLSITNRQITLPTGAGTSRWGDNDWRMLLFAGGTYDEDTGVYSSEPLRESSVLPGQKILPSVAHGGGSEVVLNTMFVNAPSADAADPWLPVSVTRSGTVVRFSVPNVQMEPQGALVMLQAKNETLQDTRSYVDLYGFVVETNMASVRATYSLYALSTKAAPQYQGSEGGFRSEFTTVSNSNQPLRLRPTAPLDVNHASRYSRVYMLHVYPTALAQGQTGKFTVRARFESYNASNGTTSPRVLVGTTVTTPLMDKRSYQAHINVSRRQGDVIHRQTSSFKHPIETLLIDDATSRTARTYGPGRFSSTADKDVFYEGRSYYMPDEAQLRILVPGMHGGMHPGGQLTLPIVRFGDRVNAAVRGVAENIQVFNESRPFHGDYYWTGGDIVYAMRFLNNQDNPQKEWRSAYRYERFYRGTTPVLKITVRHIGVNLPDLTVDQIANEAWWNRQQTGVINEYVRYIPQGQYWSSSGLPLMPRKKLVMRIFYNEPYEMGDRGNGVFVTDYNAFRQWAEYEANIDTKTVLFTKQKDVEY